MKDIFKYMLTAFFFISLSFTNAQDKASVELSLKDIIKLTVDNHPLIKQKEDELRAAQYRVEQQNSSYLPNVSGRATYTRIAPIPAFSFGGMTMELAPDNNYNFGVFVHQTLYDFGKRDSQVDYASSFLKSINDNEDLIKNDLTNQAIRTYYSILFLQKSIAVKDTQVILLQEHIKITEAKIKNGVATDYDVLSTKTKIIEIQNDKIELQNEMAKQELYIKELIGLERNKNISITGELFLPQANINADSLRTAALNQRQELKILKDNQNSARLNKDIASLLDKPTVSADFGYGFKNGYEPNIQVLRGNWFLGVTLDVPVFNGNLTKNKIAEADANIGLADNKITQIKETIFTDIYQALSDLNSNVKKISSTREQINYASKYLERADIQYARGAGTNLEVLDAQTALTQARLFNVQALYKSVISYYSLRRAVGDKLYLN